MSNPSQSRDEENGIYLYLKPRVAIRVRRPTKFLVRSPISALAPSHYHPHQDGARLGDFAQIKEKKSNSCKKKSRMCASDENASTVVTSPVVDTEEPDQALTIVDDGRIVFTQKEITVSLLVYTDPNATLSILVACIYLTDCTNQLTAYSPTDSSLSNSMTGLLTHSLAPPLTHPPYLLPHSLTHNICCGCRWVWPTSGSRQMCCRAHGQPRGSG